MDTKRTILTSAAAVLAVLPFPASAQIGGISGPNLSISSLGLSIANALWIVFTIIAVIAFVIAGILFLTAFGDAEKIKTARSAFLWGVVGIIVAILAYSIISLIRGAIGA